MSLSCPSSSAATVSASSVVPIVYVFTVNPFFSCKTFNTRDHHYIRFSVEQAVRTARGPAHAHPVILTANFRDCNHSLATVQQHWHRDIVALDYTAFLSRRTVEFTSLTDTLFMQSYMPELWAAAALRFFVLEDLMVHRGYPQVLHVEGDNLLYGDTAALIRGLAAGYPGLAATPLSKTLDFVTASVLWVGK